MKILSDIEIAQACAMRPIAEIAQAAGVDGKYLELYGNYKAKVDYRLLRESPRPDGKLILITAKGMLRQSLRHLAERRV